MRFKRSTIEDMRLMARGYGGECLSLSYEHSSIKLKWRCEKGHVWEAVSDNARRHWCPVCGKEEGDRKLRIPFSTILKTAIERGGKCLSPEQEYKDGQSRLLWQCELGHTWYAKATLIYGKKTWCPSCSPSYGERITRNVFEQIFKHPFPVSRPVWLKNLQGHRMELDGYCQELGIAFEHQGRQHYEFVPHYHHDTKEKFHQRLENDKIKRNLCVEKNIILIEIPEIPHNLSVNNVISYVLKQCRKVGIKNLPHENSISIDFKTVCTPLTLFNKTIEIIKSHGGVLLESHFLGESQGHRVQCEYGHIWKTFLAKIRKGTWCPYCRREKKFDQVKNIAEQKGGRCLSEKYSVKEKLWWQCSNNHTWYSKARSIREGYWCPHCYNDKRSSNFYTKIKGTRK